MHSKVVREALAPSPGLAVVTATCAPATGKAMMRQAFDRRRSEVGCA